MSFDRQQAILYVLVILTIVLAVVAIQVWQLAHDAGPILRSPAARAVAGLGASL